MRKPFAVSRSNFSMSFEKDNYAIIIKTEVVFPINVSHIHEMILRSSMVLHL